MVGFLYIELHVSVSVSYLLDLILYFSYQFHILFHIHFMYYDSTNIRQNKVLLGQQEVKLATTVASDKLCTIEKIQVFWDVILHC